MSAAILQRIAALPVLPELRAALETLVEQDWDVGAPAVEESGTLGAVLAVIYRELGGNDISDIQPFLSAWYTLRAVLLRLDHLQDDDPESSVSVELATSTGQQYNLLFSCYLLAMAVLDDLEDQDIPPSRFRRLLRLWNDSLLCAAGGQQRDLITGWSHNGPQDVLNYYEQAVRAKAGSIYALGYGGVATLATDDQTIQQVVSLIGELYGTLLQLNDDLFDAAMQVTPALTLPQVYRAASTAAEVLLPPHSVKHFARFIHHAYFEHVKTLIVPLPLTAREAIIGVFRRSFPLIDFVNDEKSSTGDLD